MRAMATGSGGRDGAGRVAADGETGRDAPREGGPPRGALRVGELAKRAGLSVRTLHHYDEIGLLRPSRRTHAGHRLYGAEDVARLQRIASLRRLGFSLDEIRACLERPELSARRLIELHLGRLREQIELRRQLCERLEDLGRWLDRADAGASAAGRAAPLDDLLEILEMMAMVESYYTPEQLEYLKRRREAVGEERIREVEAEWPRLIAEVRAEMERGTDPADPRVQALARRWTGLVEEFTGGNPEIARAARKIYEDQAPVAQQMGIDRELMAYVETANRAAGGRE
jgi:MerR family transcriptional regulator, thiopeptide resistance regulator